MSAADPKCWQGSYHGKLVLCFFADIFHCALQVQQYDPLHFARQNIALNPRNMWAILKNIVDACVKLPEGLCLPSSACVCVCVWWGGGGGNSCVCGLQSYGHTVHIFCLSHYDAAWFLGILGRRS